RVANANGTPPSTRNNATLAEFSRSIRNYAATMLRVMCNVSEESAGVFRNDTRSACGVTGIARVTHHGSSAAIASQHLNNVNEQRLQNAHKRMNRDHKRRCR